MIADNAAQRQVSAPQSLGQRAETVNHSPISAPTFLTIYDFLAELNELYTADARLLLDVLIMARDAHVDRDQLIAWLQQQLKVAAQ